MQNQKTAVSVKNYRTLTISFMARTESNAIDLGTVAPDFSLLDVRSNRVLTRDQIFAPIAQDKPRLGFLVMFVCVHCPFVKHIEEELGRIGNEFYGAQGEGPIAIAAISSNDIAAYPQDAPEFMQEQADRCGWTFPYLHDASQQVAKRYHAACTPDLYLFDQEMKLVYHGQLDNSRPQRKDGSGNDLAVDGADLRAAIRHVLQHEPPLQQQIPALGCNIKWKEPEQV